jgi:dipeptidyl-peptidase 4
MKFFLAILPLFLYFNTFSQRGKEPKKSLALDEIWSGYFDEKDLKPKILNTKNAVAFIRADKTTNEEAILTLDLPTGKIVDTLFTNKASDYISGSEITFTFFEDFEFSPDDSKLLIKSEKEAIFNTSSKEFVFLWDNVKKTLKPVSTDGKIACVNFSPDGKKLAFIRDANIYVKDIETNTTTPITTDGNFGSIINGMADEMYEDGFGLNQLYQWSPDGNKIVFIKINQGFVKTVPIPKYDKSYTTITQQKYVLPGEAISEAAVYVYDLKTKGLVKANLGYNTNQYITGANFTPDGKAVLVQKLTRTQKQFTIEKVQTTTGENLGIVYEETAPDYVKPSPLSLKFLPNKKSFFWLSEKDGFQHIFEVGYDSIYTKQITSGNWEVNEIKGFDERTENLFFTANERGVGQMHLYKQNAKSKKPTRITNDRGFHTVWLSNDYKYYFDKSTNINSPSVFKIFSASGREVTNTALIENKLLKDKLVPYEYSDAKFFTCADAIGQYELNGWVMRPTGESLKKKSPLLLYVYGGNTFQLANDEFNDRQMMTFRYFASKGYTVACIDTRGTPGQGKKFRNANYLKPGTVEVDDIIAAKQYLLRNFSIDTSNTILMGWSYGGFLTTLTATKKGGSFSKFVAIAPVTDWRDYSNVYTERILTLPGENPDGYENANPKNAVSNYQGGLLIIHGSADSKVHLQHSMKLARALSEIDADFEIQVFPDKAHNISDGGLVDKTRMNLYRRIFRFLERKLR